MTDKNDMRKHLEILRLVRSFGPMALTIITLDSEMVSMGSSKPEEAISAIKEKMTSLRR